MKLPSLFLLVILLFPTSSNAQRPGTTDISSGDLGSGRFSDFQPVELFTLSGEQMTQVASEDELVAIFSIQGENSVVAARGYTLFSSERDGDCRGERVHCIVISHEDWLIFPFGFASAGGLGSTRVVKFSAARRVRVSEEHMAAILSNRDLRERVEVASEDELVAANGHRLVSTAGDNSDCSSPRVTCGVVFEVETTLTLFGLGRGN